MLKILLYRGNMTKRITVMNIECDLGIKLKLIKDLKVCNVNLLVP